MAPHTLVAPEPDWHIASTWIHFARLLQISNLGNVSDTLKSITSPESKTRTYRNYVVHQNKRTADRLKQVVRNNGWNSANHLHCLNSASPGKATVGNLVRQLPGSGNVGVRFPPIVSIAAPYTDGQFGLDSVI